MQAGPNAPLNGLAAVLDGAAARGAPPSKLVLGLPLYAEIAVYL